jgi:hypothetical protein
MKFTKYIGASALIAATLTFTACTQEPQTNSHGNSYSKYGMSEDALYRMGKDDGCNSGKGIVTPGIRNGNEVKYQYSKDYSRGFKKGVDLCLKK